MVVEKEEGINIINSSADDASSKITYITEKRKYLIYNYHSIQKSLKETQELLDNQPDFLVDTEIEFLKEFQDTFKKSYVHNGYQLKSEDYVRLLNKAVNSLEERDDIERIELSKKQDNVEKSMQIGLSFYLVKQILEEIKINLFTDYDILKNNPKAFIKYVGMLNKTISYLIQTYYYAFNFLLEKQSFKLETLSAYNEELDTYWSYLKGLPNFSTRYAEKAFA